MFLLLNLLIAVSSQTCSISVVCGASNACESFRTYLSCVLQANKPLYGLKCQEVIGFCPNYKDCGCDCTRDTSTMSLAICVPPPTSAPVVLGSCQVFS